AVTGNDDGNRIAPHCLTDVARRLPFAGTELPRQFPVGGGRAPADAAHRLVEPAAERIDAFEIDRDGREVDALAGEIFLDIRDQRLHPLRRPSTAGAPRP